MQAGWTPKAGGTCRSPTSPTSPTCKRRARATSGRANRSGLTWRRPMSELLVHGAGAPRADGTILEVTPQSARWRYVGFEVVSLVAGVIVRRDTGDRELCVVVVEGTATVSSEHGRWR